MAGIDKTYAVTYDQYKSVLDWAKSVGTVIDEYGNKIMPYGWIYYTDITEDDFNEFQNKEWNLARVRAQTDKEFVKWMTEYHGENFLEDKTLFFELPIWNTATYQDIWLIRNCPVDFIQERLKQQYGDYYEKIKNHTSVYDTFERNGLGKNVHFSIEYIKENHLKRFKEDDIHWFIESMDISAEYNDELDTWILENEARPWTSNMRVNCGNMSKRKIYRMLRKWDLPKGFKLLFDGLYKGCIVKEFIVTTK